VPIAFLLDFRSSTHRFTLAAKSLMAPVLHEVLTHARRWSHACLTEPPFSAPVVFGIVWGGVAAGIGIIVGSCVFQNHKQVGKASSQGGLWRPISEPLTLLPSCAPCSNTQGFSGKK
jgi:hypothetical protein